MLMSAVSYYELLFRSQLNVIAWFFWDPHEGSVKIGQKPKPRSFEAPQFVSPLEEKDKMKSGP